METHSVSQKKNDGDAWDSNFGTCISPILELGRKEGSKCPEKREEITLPGHPNYSLLDPSTFTIIVAQ